jgi:hypothetical protein
VEQHEMLGGKVQIVGTSAKRMPCEHPRSGASPKHPRTRRTPQGCAARDARPPGKKIEGGISTYHTRRAVMPRSSPSCCGTARQV